ncbi:vitamin K epoxide reductase family protein [Epilithonimonas hungarica]|uniref:Thioredoxin n=1 Tax=Epilithonimonas hungarica TaxID=454006 RepID=A0A1G7GRQ9_9FLAO|nr:vitamin K epoxide reductase family protein [Epilithonimonas hungarica]SDE90804.1 Thioredoxin [Epilithonimonas hungarica]
MTTNQDLEAIFSYARSQNIILDKAEFQFQVETHPDYPSLLAFTDAFSFFKIPNIATKIYADQIENLPNSFVALLGDIGDNRKEDYLSHITEKNGKYHFTHEKQTKKLNIAELKQYWKDIVFLAEKSENFADTKPKSTSVTNMMVCIFALLVLGIVYLFSASIFAVLFGTIYMAGIFLSIEALKSELGIESTVSKNMCNIVANADCAQVINSDKNTWLKSFKISDVSIWFFSSELLSLLLFSVYGVTENYFALLIFSLVLAIPMTLYSIYFQYKVEKKWCPICLSIIALIYVQLLLLVINHPAYWSFNLKNVTLFVFGFAVVAFSIYMIKPFLLNIKNLKENNIKNLRFKRNYTIFKNNLEKEEQQFFISENLVLGNLNSKLKISIITSPLCGYCKKAHEILHEILKNNYENLCISIRFNYREFFDNNTQDLFCRLLEIHKEKGDFAFCDALQNWFETKNLKEWLLKFGEPVNSEQSKNGLLLIAAENESKNLNFTPNIFINQYKFPDLYDNQDLEYFITDLIED